MLFELRWLTLNQRVLHISEALGLSSARVGLEKRDSCFVIHSFSKSIHRQRIQRSSTDNAYIFPS